MIHKKLIFLIVVVILLAVVGVAFFKRGSDEQKAAEVIRTSRDGLDIVCKVTIPDELEEEMTFHEKGGSEIRMNAHELYKDAFETGWQEYLERFQSVEIDLDETYVEPHLRQEWGLTMDARHEGFQQCRNDILNYEKRHHITFKPLRNPYIKALLNSGADLDFEDYPPAYDDGPTQVSFSGVEITDADLKPMQNFSSMIEVDVSGTSITDLGLGYIKASPGMWNLDLGGTAITDEGISSLLGFKKLEILDLSNTVVTDRGVSKLSALPSLEALTLEGCAITDQALSALAEAPKLRCLYLGKNADESFSLSFKHDPKSGSMDVDMDANHPRVIASAPKITDAGIVAIAKMKALESLGLEGSAITDMGLTELRSLNRLQSLRLDDTPVTDAGLQSLASLADLDWISLKGLNITDDGLKALGGLVKLETLVLTDCKLTDACLVQLKGCTALKSIWRTGTQITDEGIEELQKNLPNLRKD